MVRLSNLSLSTTALDWETDSDYDGLPDLLEIGTLKSIDIFGCTIEYYANYSDPYDPDTDGDGLLDGEAPHVNQYDVVYKEFYELTAQSEDKGNYPVDQFYTNTGKMSFKMFCEEYTAIDYCNDVNVGNRYSSNIYRHLQSYLQAMEDTAFGKAYTLDEIIYIGHTDPELAKLLARELDLEDWKRIYAGLMFGVYDGRIGKVRNLDGSEVQVIMISSSISIFQVRLPLL